MVRREQRRSGLRRLARGSASLSVAAALVVGFALGASADALPGPLGNAFGDPGVVAEAMDGIEANYIEDIERQRLEDAAITGAVRELEDEFSAAIAFVKGPARTTVRLRLRRDGETVRKSLERERIEVPAVSSKLRRAGAKRVRTGETSRGRAWCPTSARATTGSPTATRRCGVHSRSWMPGT